VCNIRITAKFEATDFEPFTSPVLLLDPKRMGIPMLPYYRNKNLEHLTRVFVFEYRKYNCMVDLFIHLGNEKYGMGRYGNQHYNQRYEYMNDKYMIVIQKYDEFLDEAKFEYKYRYYGDRTLEYHKVFIWTVVPNQDNITEVDNLMFRETFFVCRAY